MSGPGGVAGDRLRAFVERIERLEEEIKQLSDDKKDVYAEAKGDGAARRGGLTVQAKSVAPLSRLERLIIASLLSLPAVAAVAVLQGYLHAL